MRWRYLSTNLIFGSTALLFLFGFVWFVSITVSMQRFESKSLCCYPDSLNRIRESAVNLKPPVFSFLYFTSTALFHEVLKIYKFVFWCSLYNLNTCIKARWFIYIELPKQTLYTWIIDQVIYLCLQFQYTNQLAFMQWKKISSDTHRPEKKINLFTDQFFWLSISGATGMN